MNKATIIKNILVVSSILMLAGIFLGCEKTNTNEAPEIFEIKNTEEAYNNPKISNVITVRRHFMILNPPKDLIQLKELAEKHIEEYKLEEKVQPVEGKERVFQVYFYRESGNLPRDWEPVESFLSDRIDKHKEDLIVSIYWADTIPQKRYYSMNKSEDGKVIERIEFLEDNIIK